MAYFPMFVDLDRQPCLVAGGGNVAARKVQVLRDFGAKVTVIAPDCSEKIMDMASNDKMIEIIKRPFMESDCRGYLLVVAATDDKALNHDISEYCKNLGIMVNAVDQKDDCSFIFSSYIKEKNLVAAFSSGGNSPALTQYLKSEEKDILTPFLGELNEFMGSIREKVLKEYDTEAERKKAFEAIINSAVKEKKLPDNGSI